jgi:hypothetical protein
MHVGQLDDLASPLAVVGAPPFRPKERRNFGLCLSPTCGIRLARATRSPRVSSWLAMNSDDVTTAVESGHRLAGQLLTGHSA